MKLPVAAGCVSLAFTAGIADVHAAKKGSAEQKRPNILFCVADDAGHFGAYG